MINDNFRAKLKPAELSWILLNNLDKFDSKPDHIFLILNKLNILKKYSELTHIEFYENACEYFNTHKKFPDIKWLEAVLPKKAIKEFVDVDNFSMYIYEDYIECIKQEILKCEVNKFADNDILTDEKCQKMIEKISSYQTSKKIGNIIDIIETIQDIQKQPLPSFLVNEAELFPRKYFSFLFTEPGKCKTWLVLDLALAFSKGQAIFGKWNCSSKKVLFLEGDTDNSILTKRINMLENNQISNSENFLIINKIKSELNGFHLGLSSPDGKKNIEEIFEQSKPDIVFIDTIGSFLECNENKQDEVSPIMDFLKQLANKFDCHIVIIHHARKRGTAEKRRSLDQSDMIGTSTFSKFACHNIGIDPWYEKDTMEAKKEAGVIDFKKNWYKPVEVFKFQLIESINDSGKSIRIHYDHDIQIEPVTITKSDSIKNILKERIESNPRIEIKITDIEKEFDVHINTLRPIFKELEKENYIKRISAGKNTHYVSAYLDCLDDDDIIEKDD